MRSVYGFVDRATSAAMAAMISAYIFCPIAYVQRGYFDIGGEIFLVAIAAAFGWERAERREEREAACVHGSNQR